MGDRIQSATHASQRNFGASFDNSATTTVRLGESTLSDVARNRNLDPGALLEANPQITDPHAILTIGQEIRLPFCQAPAQDSGTLPVPAQVSSGDSVAKSVVHANLKTQAELSPDEKLVKATYGEAALRVYKETKTEFAEARQAYLKTGKVPPLKHHAPIEIITGDQMTRAERYDANLVRQGLSASYPKMDVEVDPSYLSWDEFRDEWLSRGKKEMQACDDEYIRPGKKQKCWIKVKEKYMGKEYMDASFAATAAAWNNGAYIEKIKNSGPVALAGRVIGRGVGYAVDGKAGADKGEEIGGAVGGLGDAGLAIKSGANARARVKAYEGSAGLEASRGQSTIVVNTPRPATGGAPDVAPAGVGSSKNPSETFLLSHGTDTPGFRGMGGLGKGQIRVDHSPGGRQDFGRGFYVAVGAPEGVGIAEAFGDKRVAQRKSGPRQVMAWEVKRSDLGDVVDVRPGGEHAEAWNRYLDQPLAAGVKMTVRDYIRGTGVEHRGEYFERFLQSIGKQNADVVIGPVGTKETAGVTPYPGTQISIRSQRVADTLNKMMGGGSGPTGPADKPEAKTETNPSSNTTKKGEPSVWRKGSGTSVHNPNPASNQPSEPPFTEAEEVVIRSYIRSGKTRAEAEQLVKDTRGPENEITVVRPNSPGTTRVPDWKKPGPGKKRP